LDMRQIPDARVQLCRQGLRSVRVMSNRMQTRGDNKHTRWVSVRCRLSLLGGTRRVLRRGGRPPRHHGGEGRAGGNRKVRVKEKDSCTQALGRTRKFIVSKELYGA